MNIESWGSVGGQFPPYLQGLLKGFNGKAKTFCPFQKHILYKYENVIFLMSCILCLHSDKSLDNALLLDVSTTMFQGQYQHLSLVGKINW